MGLDGQKYIDKLVEYLEQELGEHWIPEEWNKEVGQRSEQQLIGSDCGVFTLMNALVLIRGDGPDRVLANNGMDDARKRIAATLLAGRPTTELE
jgi:Ulp1 family protease